MPCPTTTATDGDLVERSRAGADDARRELTVRYQPLVLATAARLHRSRGTSHDDVVSCGQEGLQKAIRDYDPTRAVQFAAYAKAKVRGEMMRWFRDGRYEVHVPRTLHELAMRVRTVQREIESTTGISPTVDQLAGHLDASPESVIEALAVSSAERLRSAELGAWVRPSSPAHGHPDVAAAFENLAQRDRRVLHHRYIDRMSQREIGEVLGVSQAHVSRLEATALTQLREQLPRRGARRATA